MKITEIEIDDSQTGYYWIQIYTSNQKQAISLKNQILADQDMRERLEKEIVQSQNLIARSTNKMEMAVQNFLLEKLLSISEGNNET
ncbi:MAG: hypothetical protein OES15_01330 [Nitrosopumilus sp.]|jgi:hypothetical protein|nr:hypothetical protein [Nitrosopumilus sp.]